MKKGKSLVVSGNHNVQPIRNYEQVRQPIKISEMHAEFIS